MEDFRNSEQKLIWESYQNSLNEYNDENSTDPELKKLDTHVIFRVTVEGVEGDINTTKILKEELIKYLNVKEIIRFKRIGRQEYKDVYQIELYMLSPSKNDAMSEIMELENSVNIIYKISPEMHISN